VIWSALAALAANAAPTPSPPPRYAQLIVRESVMVRLRRGQATPSTVRWREKKGDRCVALANVAGALITEPDSVDFILRGGSRVRARLDRECPALDYYSGFYLRPSDDGMICADRDTVHARSGGSCTISRFRKLVPDKKK